MRAVKSYTMYKKQMLLEDPDTQLDSVKNSLQFIAKYCIEHNIYFHQYPHQRTADIFTWMKHYKENKINIYSVMEFTNIFSSVTSLSEEIQKFFVGQFVEQFKELYTKYKHSTQLKQLVAKTVPLLEDFVERQLTKKKHEVL
jgi:hypothetical protein